VFIRNKLDHIDNLLRKECLFCGPILIDMVDNEVGAVDTKLYEFGGAGDINSLGINKYENDGGFG